MILATALLLFCVVLGGVLLRYRGADLAWALPAGVSVETAWWVLAGATALAGVAILLDRKRWRQGAARRAFLEVLAVLGVAWAYEWTLLAERTFRPVDWGFYAALAAGVAVLLWAGRSKFGVPGLGKKSFGPAAARLAPWTLLFVLAAVAGWVVWRPAVDWAQVAFSAATYPLYALAQLLVFQVFLVPRLRKMARPDWPACLAAGALFALAHWPNAWLMGGCLVAGVVWAWVYCKRPNVYATALAMGLAATAFADLLPLSITHNMRTGPFYVWRARQMARDAEKASKAPRSTARAAVVSDASRHRPVF